MSFAQQHRRRCRLPDGGTVADLEASGGVALAVGGVSAANTGAIPMDSAGKREKTDHIESPFLAPGTKG